MIPNREDIERYLQEVLGQKPKIKNWSKADSLPFYLHDTYTFESMDLFDTHCVLMIENLGFKGASEVRKHIDTLGKSTDEIVVFVTEALSSYDRKRLIHQRVPFIVPGNQLFIPSLGMDLREYFRKRHVRPEWLSPATQAMLIRTLLRSWQPEVHPSELGKHLGYTAMTVSRAANELVQLGLAENMEVGRERWLSFQGTAQEVWEKALPMLRSPVKKIVWPNSLPPSGISTWVAGLSALARRSMLAEPKRPVLAISSEQWKEAKQELGICAWPNKGDASYELQIWSYNPSLQPGRDEVDPLSLFLSLREEQDERVQQALDELKETMPW